MSIDFDREDKLRALRDKGYTYIIMLADNMTEPERRYFLVGFANYLLEGVAISMRTELMGDDLQKSLNPEKRG